MKREELAEILRGAAMAEGYSFHIGAVHRMNGTVRVYPAAWLEPPVLKSSEGHREGNVVYRITMHLMALPIAAEGHAAILAGLECDAMTVIRAVAGDAAVCGTANISCIPAEQSLTAHGEISMAVSCDITMWYYI